MHRRIRPIEALEARRLLASLQFDSNFAGGYAELSADTRRVADLAMEQADGKILVVGHTVVNADRGALSLVRYNADGLIDNSFAGGKGATADPTSEQDVAMAMIVSPSGQIIVLSQEQDNSDYETDIDGFSVTRFDADGSIDASFGKAGFVQVSEDDDISQMFLLPDGRIDLLGDQSVQLTASGKVSSTAPGTNDSKIATPAVYPEIYEATADSPKGDTFDVTDIEADYDHNGNPEGASGTITATKNGKPDPHFGTKGVVTYTLDDTTISLAEVIAQPDGKLLIVGTADNPSDFAILRFTAIGAADKSFGNNGVVFSPRPGLQGSNNLIATDADGKILVVGHNNAVGQTFVRYNLDGTIDNTFAVDPALLAASAIYFIQPLPDGTIMASGFYKRKPVVARFTSSGKLDTIVAGRGYVNVPNTVMAAKSDGSFVVADDTTVWRYHGDGTLDTSFGKNGHAAITPVSDSFNFSTLSIGVQSDGKVIVTGSARVNSDDDRNYAGENIIRFTASGKRDESFGADGGGVSYIPDYTDGGAVLQTAIGPQDQIYSLTADMDGGPELVGYDRNGMRRTWLPDSENAPLDAGFDPSMVIQPDGKIVLASDQDFYSNNDRDTIQMTRLNPDGSPDLTFYGTGSRQIDLGNDALPTGIAVGGNGDLYVTGNDNIESEYYDPVTSSRAVLLRVRGQTAAGTMEVDDNGTLEIVGGDQNDTLTASVSGGKLQLVLDGKKADFSTKNLAPIAIYMQGGNDRVDLGDIPIAASIFGGDGNDTLIGGAGNDTLDGGAGADQFFGGAGFDTVSYASRPDALNLSLNGKADDGAPGEHDNIGDGSDIEHVVGGYGNDVIVGGAHNDHLDGGPDPDPYNLPVHDSLYGMGGDDTLYGWQVNGGAGNDTMGGSAPDEGDPTSASPVGVADYSDRTDALVADLDAGTVKFGSGETDTLLNGVITFVAGSGNDRITQTSITDAEQASTIRGGAGNDTISGASGDEWYTTSYAYGEGGDDQLSGSDVLVGGTQADLLIALPDADSMISYQDRTSPVAIDLSQSEPVVTPSDGDTFKGDFAGAIGGSKGDTIIGSKRDESLLGGGGDDLLAGGGGNDCLQGQNGNDTMQGGGGNDSLDGGAGADVYEGGRGIDLADYSSRRANLNLSLDNVANDGAAGEGDNIMTDVEQIAGGSGNDSIIGDSLPNDLNGGSGSDTIYGEAGDDSIESTDDHSQLYGGDGKDLFEIFDGPLSDTIDGGGGHDTAHPWWYNDPEHVNDHFISIETILHS